MRWQLLNAHGDVPQPRALHAATICGKRMFVSGGWVNVKQRVDHLYIYDFETGYWKQIKKEPSPSRRSSHSLCCCDNKVIMFGGCGGGFQNDVWELNTDQLKWEQAYPSGMHPSPRGCHSAVVWKHFMVIFGGKARTSDFDDTYIYDIYNQRWEWIDSAPMPHPRYDHSAVVDDQSMMWIFGGKTKPEGWLQDLWRFDIENRRWMEIKWDHNAIVPSPRTGHQMCAVSSEYLIVFGGWSQARDLNDLWIFDKVHMRWNKLFVPGSLPPVRNCHTMKVRQEAEEVIVFGGRDRNHKFNDLWSLDIHSLRSRIRRDLEVMFDELLIEPSLQYSNNNNNNNNNNTSNNHLKNKCDQSDKENEPSESFTSFPDRSSEANSIENNKNTNYVHSIDNNQKSLNETKFNTTTTTENKISSSVSLSEENKIPISSSSSSSSSSLTLTSLSNRMDEMYQEQIQLREKMNQVESEVSGMRNDMQQLISLIYSHFENSTSEKEKSKPTMNDDDQSNESNETHESNDFKDDFYIHSLFSV